MRLFLGNPVMLILILVMAGQSFLNGSFNNPGQWFIDTLLTLPGIIIGLSFHEYAHAKMSNLLGDPTPKLQGRVTINPAAHIDPVGFIALLFIGFGWGRPVEVNGTYYKKFKRDEILVSLAGVTMNLILAILFTGVFKLIIMNQVGMITGINQLIKNPETAVMLLSYLATMVQITVQINLVLMVFNLLPVPPLDGFNVVAELLHLREKGVYYQIYEKGPIILMLLILFNVTGRILSPIIYFLMNGLFSIFGL